MPQRGDLSLHFRAASQKNGGKPVYGAGGSDQPCGGLL